MEVFAESIRSMKDLKKIVMSDNVSKEQKNILQSLIQNRKLKK